jgi:hypothetical protein
VKRSKKKKIQARQVKDNTDMQLHSPVSALSPLWCHRIFLIKEDPHYLMNEVKELSKKIKNWEVPGTCF